MFWVQAKTQINCLLFQITPFDPAKKKKKKVVIRDPAEDDIVDNLAEKTESLFVSDGLETSFACLKKKKKSVHTNLLSDEKENVGGDRDRVQQLTLTRLCSFNFQLQIYTFFLFFLPFRSLFEFARHRIAVLSLLRKYDEVIQLCEQTLHISEKNLASADVDDSNCKSSHVRLWRWRLQSKSHYHLGRLDIFLDLIEKQEELISIGTKYRNMNQEPSIPFATTVRELLNLKKLGNEAFQSGRHTEAVEHYTAAISKSGESRHFMAICFCNRAAAYQALGQIVDAIADCSVAIALDDNYQKALSRRATLHEMIRDYKQAVCDLQRVVSLLESPLQAKTRQSGGQDKSNCGSAKDLRRTRRRLSLIEEKAKTETQLDLYVILGIKSSDTESEIKKAYRKAALRHHPDKAGQLLARSEGLDDGRLWKEVGENIHKDADRLFKIIGEAYAVLSDPIKRSKYNDEDEVRNYYRDSNSERQSTSYSSPYENGNRYGRQSGFYNSSTARSNSGRYWNESWKSYGNSNPRW